MLKILIAAGLVVFSTHAKAFTVVYEFYHQASDHYFRTGTYDEAQMLEQQRQMGWVRTGKDFIAGVRDMPGNPNYTLDDQLGLIEFDHPKPQPAMYSVCRFFAPLATSHFYTADPAECEMVKRTWPDIWNYEELAFSAVLPIGPNQCPAQAPVPVYRVFNNKASGNHRYITDLAVYQQMQQKGWVPEGVVMCAFDDSADEVKRVEQERLFMGTWLFRATDTFTFVGMQFDYHPNTVDRFYLIGSYTNGTGPSKTVWANYQTTGIETRYVSGSLPNYYYNWFYNLKFRNGGADLNHMDGCFSSVPITSSVSSCTAIAGTRLH